MSVSGKGLWAFPENIKRDGTRIYDAADYTDELVSYTRSGREQIEAACGGPPWGSKGEYAEQMQKNLGEAEEKLYMLLDYVAVAQRQAADGTFRSGDRLGGTEDLNNDISGNIMPGTGGRR